MNYLTKEYGITKKMLNEFIRERLNEEGFGSSKYIKDGAWKPYPDPSQWGGFYHGDPYESAHGSFTEDEPLLEIYIYERPSYSGDMYGELVDVVTVGDILVHFEKIKPRPYASSYIMELSTPENSAEETVHFKEVVEDGYIFSTGDSKFLVPKEDFPESPDHKDIKFRFRDKSTGKYSMAEL